VQFVPAHCTYKKLSTIIHIFNIGIIVIYNRYFEIHEYEVLLVSPNSPNLLKKISGPQSLYNRQLCSAIVFNLKSVFSDIPKGGFVNTHKSQAQ